MMTLYCQRDNRWGGKTIGNSKSLIKDYGCTISAIASLSSWYGCDHDPAWMAKNLRFLNDLILWQSINEKLCFKWKWRAYGYQEKRILDSIKGETTSCILQVYSRHWVVGIKKIGNYYWVGDPFDGRRKFIHKKYITGSAHFDK